jgi:hypothetical protein
MATESVVTLHINGCRSTFIQQKPTRSRCRPEPHRKARRQWLSLPDCPTTPCRCIVRQRKLLPLRIVAIPKDDSQQEDKMSVCVDGVFKKIPSSVAYCFTFDGQRNKTSTSVRVPRNITIRNGPSHIIFIRLPLSHFLRCPAFRSVSGQYRKIHNDHFLSDLP